MIKHMLITLYSHERTDVFYPDVAESWALERESHSQGYPIYSGVMVCPFCVSIWARLTIQGEAFHEARSIPCRRHPEACHPDLRPVAGSLLDNPTANGIDEPLLDSLPPDLLRREFDLHLKASWDD